MAGFIGGPDWGSGQDLPVRCPPVLRSLAALRGGGVSPGVATVSDRTFAAIDAFAGGAPQFEAMTPDMGGCVSSVFHHNRASGT